MRTTRTRTMRRRAKRAAAAGVLPLLALTALASLTGCGGAGTGASLNQPSLTPRQQDGGGGATGGRNAAIPTQRLNLFLSAAAPATADDKGAAATARAPEDAHLWVTLHRVELLENDEQKPAEVVFEDEDGRVTDLASLRADDPKRPLVELLSRSPVGMARKTTRVRITFGKAFQRFAPGADVGRTALFAESVARDAEGRPILTATLGKPRDLATGRENLVLALGIAESAARDGTVVPVVREMNDDALRLDGDRQVPVEFEGLVGDVTGEAPGQTFAMTTAPGRPLSVRLSAATVLTNADGKPSPALAGAKRAVARGRLDPQSGALLAEAVTLYADEKAGADATRLRGAVADLAEDGSTFTIRPAQVAGMQPTQTAVTVTLSPDAVLRSRGGLPVEKDALRRALSARGALAEVEGLYEPSTATLVARRVRATGGGSGPGDTREALLLGASATPDAEGKGLTLKQFVEWDGVNAPATAKAVPVSVTGATAYADREGKKIDAAAFFAALRNADAGNAVRALGLLSGDGKMTATRLELRPAPPKPAPSSPAAATTAAAGTKPGAKPEGKGAASAEAAKEEKAEPAPKAPEKK